MQFHYDELRNEGADRLRDRSYPNIQLNLRASLVVLSHQHLNRCGQLARPSRCTNFRLAVVATVPAYRLLYCRRQGLHQHRLGEENAVRIGIYAAATVADVEHW